MKEKNEQLPNIFEYNNFRNYLRDYFKAKHAIDISFTKSFICKELGLPNSRSYFGDILNGKFLSSIKVPFFIKLLRLNKEETQFFRCLVNFNQADDPEECELFFDQLVSLNRTPKRIVTANTYEYYRHWYHAAIRAVLNIINFDDNYTSLAKKVFPAITIKQAKESVKLLIQLGLITKNESGFYKPTDKTISTDVYSKDELIKQYQLQCLELARKIVVVNDKQPQRVLTKMMSISEKGYQRIEKRLAKFNSEVNSIIHKDEDKADRVYQLNVQLFPNSTQENGKNSKE